MYVCVCARAHVHACVCMCTLGEEGVDPLELEYQAVVSRMT